MPDVENWDECGFPDHIYFRTMYLPTVGLIKALNERLAVFGLDTLPVPEYFSPYEGSQSFLGRFDSKIFNEGLPDRFVNLDKVQTAQDYFGCFWTAEELEMAAAGGVEEDVFQYHPLMPEFPEKWALHRYNMINLLRYVSTSEPEDWPDEFTYEDKNDTFNFKAP